MLNKTAKKLFVTFATVGAMAAMAASGNYKVDLLQDSVINGHQMKAGSYKIEIENNMAVIKHGKESIQVPAHTETAPSKYANTQVRYVNNNDLQEIHVGGTSTKIVFTEPANGATGGSF